MLRVRLVLMGVIVAFMASVAAALAQQSPAPHTPPSNPSAGANLISALGRSSYEFWLTCIICFVGILIILLLIYSVTRLSEPRAEDISRPVIVITVIMSTLILVTAGYSNEQIAPAFGLFGTIIGYILGRLSGPSSTPAPASTQPSPPPPTARPTEAP